MPKKMANIIKYEWLRRWKFFLAGLTVFSLANIDLTSRLITKGHPSMVSVILIAVLWAMVGILVFDHLGRMYKPLFGEEGIFVFSTPLSGYNLLGGKILAVVLEYVGVALFVAIVISIDFLILSKHNMGMQLPDGLSLDLVLTRGLMLSLFLLLGYLSFILTAYLSMALAKSFLSSVKHGGLMSFIIFIVITRVLFWMLAGCNYANMTIEGTGFASHWLTAVAIVTAVASSLFAATGYLLDRKVNI